MHAMKGASSCSESWNGGAKCANQPMKGAMTAMKSVKLFAGEDTAVPGKVGRYYAHLTRYRHTAPPRARHSSSTIFTPATPHISSAFRYHPTTVRQSGALKVSAS